MGNKNIVRFEVPMDESELVHVAKRLHQRTQYLGNDDALRKGAFVPENTVQVAVVGVFQDHVDVVVIRPRSVLYTIDSVFKTK